jgi:hypothetical protein
MNEIEAVLQRCGLKDEFDRQRALLEIVEVLPERLRPFVVPQVLHQDVLTLGVSSSSVIQELSYLREHLIREVNQRLQREVVRGLRFRSISLPSAPAAPLEVDVREEHRAEAEAQLEDVEDSRMRRAFSALCTTDLARQDALLAQGGRRCPRCGVVFVADGSRCPGCTYDPIEGVEEGD